MQLKKYKFPSEKELKHINRKLKSCWGLSSSDEYILCLYIPIFVCLRVVLNLFLLYWCVMLDGFAGVKNERRNQSTSPKRAPMNHKMCLLSPKLLWYAYWCSKGRYWTALSEMLWRLSSSVIQVRQSVIVCKHNSLHIMLRTILWCNSMDKSRGNWTEFPVELKLLEITLILY